MFDVSQGIFILMGCAVNFVELKHRTDSSWSGFLQWVDTLGQKNCGRKGIVPDAPGSPLVPAVFAMAEDAHEECMEADDSRVRSEPSEPNPNPPDTRESLDFRSSAVAAVRLFWDQSNTQFV
jgi:hypothetical protein